MCALKSDGNTRFANTAKLGKDWRIKVNRGLLRSVVVMIKVLFVCHGKI